MRGNASPGWYPDPAGGSGQRYWDGRQWAPSTAPLTPIKTPRWLYPALAIAALAIVGITTVATISSDGQRAPVEAAPPTVPVSTVTKTVHSSPSSPPKTGRDLDRTFITVLRNQGIPVPDPDQAVMQANAVCISLETGHPSSAVLKEIEYDFGYSADDAAFFYGAATYAYCREFNMYG